MGVEKILIKYNYLLLCIAWFVLDIVNVSSGNILGTLSICFGVLIAFVSYRLILFIHINPLTYFNKNFLYIYLSYFLLTGISYVLYGVYYLAGNMSSIVFLHTLLVFVGVLLLCISLVLLVYPNTLLNLSFMRLVTFYVCIYYFVLIIFSALGTMYLNDFKIYLLNFLPIFNIAGNLFIAIYISIRHITKRMSVYFYSVVPQTSYMILLLTLGCVGIYMENQYFFYSLMVYLISSFILFCILIAPFKNTGKVIF